MTLPKHVQKSHRWRIRPRERMTLLVFGDLIAAFLALFGSLYFWANSSTEYLELSLTFLFRRPPGWFYLLPFIWLVLMVELYDVHRAGSLRKTIGGIGAAALIGIGLYSIIYFTSEPASLPRRGVALYLLLVSILTLGWRWAYVQVFTTSALLRRVLIVGGGSSGRTLLRILGDIWPPPFYLVGIIDDDPQKLGIEIEGYRVLGGSECLLDILMEESVSDIVVAISGQMGGRMFQALLDAQESGVEITGMQVIYEDLLGRVPIFHLEADWILRSFVDQSRASAFYLLGKRIVDISGGLIGSLIFLIVFPFVSLAILVDTGRPVFYSQTRSGRGDHPYRVFKFRTMYQNAERDGRPQWASENDERATRVGLLLRKTHLDELPQFLNVLRGDMSLVGPRPERPELIAHFQNHVPFYRARLLVKPGITGWAQVNFPYTATIEETAVKLEYDLYYIKHRSLWLDLIVLLRTPATVLGFRGR